MRTSKKRITETEQQWREDYQFERAALTFNERMQRDEQEWLKEQESSTKLCKILGEHQGLAEVEEGGDAESGPYYIVWWDCCNTVNKNWGQ